jgi:hypothetical protein
MLKISIFKAIFGLYLTIHFMDLIGYSEELFGERMPYNPALGPTYEFWPNLFNLVNATQLVFAMTVASLCFAVTSPSMWKTVKNVFYGVVLILLVKLWEEDLYRVFTPQYAGCLMIMTWLFAEVPQLCAFFLWYGWSCMTNRNVLISNPGIPYVGFLLLTCALLPDLKSPKARIPHRYVWLAWFLMGFGYTASGLHKLQCPSWIDGTALQHILEGPLARDNLVRNLMISLPTVVLQLMTWFGLALEISFMPLGLFYHTRFWFWSAYLMFHLGIMTMINFTDLTLGVLMVHLFTFEPRWLRLFFAKTQKN